MKLSKKPTDWIIATANNNDDYFVSDFIIINAKQCIDFKERIIPILENNGLKGEYSEHGVIMFKFFDSSNEYYPIINDFLENNQEGWSYIELTDKEFEEIQENCVILDSCENELRVDCTITGIDRSGFSFKSYGKYCGTELYANLPLNI
jgi:hypothetical protein